MILVIMVSLSGASKFGEHEGITLLCTDRSIAMLVPVGDRRLCLGPPLPRHSHMRMRVRQSGLVPNVRWALAPWLVAGEVAGRYAHLAMSMQSARV